MNTPRNEYPRPQLVRKNWQNLNGLWEFEFDFGKSGKKRDLVNAPCSRGILVPFCPESTLSGIGYVDFMNSVWYRRKFTAKFDPENERLLLHFGAVYYECEVYINGRSAGGHRGGYTPFTLDITEFAVPGENTVVVCAEADSRNPLEPSGKQSVSYENRGCHYTRTTGIWQTVWTETVPKAYISHIRMTPDVDGEKLDLEIFIAGGRADTVKVSVSFGGKAVSAAEFALNCGDFVKCSLPVPDPVLWDIGQPNLYDISIRAGGDEVVSYFGMRKVEMKNRRFFLNGRPVFQRLVLDQGFYPDGIITAPTSEALAHDIDLSMKAGFNGARMHMKVFEPEFISYADRKGYILWGEFANWGLDDKNPESLCRILPEWLTELERDYNSPAIVGWCPFNETSERRHPDVPAALYSVTKALDPMRAVIDTSGYTHVFGYTDVFDVHQYEQDPVKYAGIFADRTFEENRPFTNRLSEKYDPKLPYFVSEYGGIYWNNDGIEVKDKSKAWGYGNAPESREEYLSRLRGLTDVLMDSPYIFGFCYTQLTDVFQEKNGIYTFDRREKFPADVIYPIFSRKARIEEE